MIVPTVGRVVLFRPGIYDVLYRESVDREGMRLAAIVTSVHSDRLVNLTVFDEWGVPQGRCDVRFRQPEDAATSEGYCEWMPHQVGQAAKAEALQKELERRQEECRPPKERSDVVYDVVLERKGTIVRYSGFESLYSAECLLSRLAETMAADAFGGKIERRRAVE